MSQPHNTVETLPALVDTKALARWSGISSERLKDLRRLGGGPSFIKVGAKQILYARTDVEAWLAAQRRSSTRDGGSGVS